MITARADVQNNTQLLCPACAADLHLQAWRDPASNVNRHGSKHADVGVQMHQVACVEWRGHSCMGPLKYVPASPYNGSDRYLKIALGFQDDGTYL